MVALTICLFSSVVLAPSIEELAAKFSALTVKSKSASHVAADFASIRQGSFTSVSDFRKAFPLERLLIDKPELFVRPDLSSPFDQETLKCRETRTHSVRAFIAHNYHQLDKAFAKMLRSTNDGFIAAVLSDAYGVADEDFVLPITDAFIAYARLKGDICMIDLLPDVFRDPEIYSQYFTPVPAFEVSPNVAHGYTVVTTRPGVGAMPQMTLGNWVTVGKDRVLALRMNQPYEADQNIILDTRTGCAVAIARPFTYSFSFDLPGWFALRNVQTHEQLIWRKDAIAPIVLPAEFKGIRMTRDGSFAVGSRPGGSFAIPINLSEPFLMTEMDVWEGVELMPKLGKELMLARNLYGLLLFTNGITETSKRFGEDLALIITERTGASLEDLEKRLWLQQLCVYPVYSLIIALKAKRYAEASFFAMGLRSLLNLRTKEDFICFVVAVLDGYRPSGMDVCVPRKLERQSLLHSRLNSARLRLLVVLDMARRVITSDCALLALAWPLGCGDFKVGLTGIFMILLSRCIYSKSIYTQRS